MLDAIIIGAGVSGLTTAYLAEQKGLNIQVLESRTRTGGRTHSIDSHGAKLDLGAAWIWPHHENINQLINELGIQVVTVHNHMMAEKPRLFFMHFWQEGEATELARGLRAALDQVNTAGSE